MYNDQIVAKKLKYTIYRIEHVNILEASKNPEGISELYILITIYYG